MAESNELEVNSPDPYLDPDNVETIDGIMVARGPHGQDFVLTEAERSTVELRRKGVLPSYRQYAVMAIQANLAQEIRHPS